MKIYINLLFLIATMTVFTQNSISGRITDTKNNTLIGVEVYAQELHKGTVTNKEGLYELKNIPNGKIKIIFSYLGYKTVSKTLIISSEKKSSKYQS